MISKKIYFHTDSKNLLFINHVMDSYEGIGIVRTLDKNSGLVCIYTAENLCDTVLNVLQDIKKNNNIKVNNLRIEDSDYVEGYEG